ncbi:MAG TPA: HAD hydrolase family protein [Bacteroidales bacterium]|nr:HAD hydrolase family protein [Bacteroidales bacterium]HPS18148.1 HAD hydrolase family protein [Bacteroidales bacterium]
MPNYKEKLKYITTFIFDYDGVMTDGKVYLLNDGDAVRTGYVRDGYAMQYALKMGFRVVIISGGRAEGVNKRFKVLMVKDVFMGVGNKLEIYHNYIKENKLSKNEILFMGDDIPDYLLMKEAGLSACPADASEEIKSVAEFISAFKGGEGCVRDVIEQTLKVQGKWFDESEAFIW